MSTWGWNGLCRRRSVWLASPPTAVLVLSEVSRWTLPAAPALLAAPPPPDLRRPLVGAGALVGLVAVRRLLSRTRPLVTAADGAGESVGAAPRDRCGADQERR